MKLDNKNILVTGANRGIGAAIVRELLKQNVGKIYAAARKPESLPDFKDKRVVAVALDITDEAQVKEAARKLGDVNAVINNAGTAHFNSVVESPAADVAKDMNTNYYGTLSVIRAFAPVLKKNGKGLIANVNSVVSLGALPVFGGYSASKAALHSATQAARIELAPHGVHVAGIYPGPVDTDMARDLQMEKATPESTAAKIVEGLIAGDSYIFPDPVSLQMGALWLRDPQALERQFAEMAAQQKAA